MDLPIAAAFTFIGILLFVVLPAGPDASSPPANADVFGSYILNVMPVGIRGLVLAGVFATAMGSLSAALNALATERDQRLVSPLVRGRSEAHHVAAARWFTVVFAVLMIVIAGAFAYAKVTHPDVRIIPVVLGIAGLHPRADAGRVSARHVHAAARLGHGQHDRDHGRAAGDGRRRQA